MNGMTEMTRLTYCDDYKDWDDKDEWVKLCTSNFACGVRGGAGPV